ncbi:putative ATP-grasp-modified RiPP [Streptomyces sp. SID8361]|nr:putative ATP-grasp-modified RiPP [Streptomyces sp. MnatMP-M27]MYU11203.1 putative ATP-grasp-modified RiPP [Streptomyces sp. SID8361]SCF79182.1 putative ATP-grasp target RiPP [Streptomyces sp. MnatMP-M27]
MTTMMTSKPSPLTPTGTGHPTHTQSLPCAEESVGIARLSVAATLRAWGLEDLVDDARLIASELATNAIRHATRHIPDPEQRSCFRLKVERPSDHLVRISTFDRSRTIPRIIEASETAESGRGMAVVDAVSCRWGIDLKPWGKGVWAECATPGRLAPGRPWGLRRLGPYPTAAEVPFTTVTIDPDTQTGVFRDHAGLVVEMGRHGTSSATSTSTVTNLDSRNDAGSDQDSQQD